MPHLSGMELTCVQICGAHQIELRLLKTTVIGWDVQTVF